MYVILKTSSFAIHVKNSKTLILKRKSINLRTSYTSILFGVIVLDLYLSTLSCVILLQEETEGADLKPGGASNSLASLMCTYMALINSRIKIYKIKKINTDFCWSGVVDQEVLFKLEQLTSTNTSIWENGVSIDVIAGVNTYPSVILWKLYGKPVFFHPLNQGSPTFFYGGPNLGDFFIKHSLFPEYGYFFNNIVLICFNQAFCFACCFDL
ncbi:hypothetical protein AGLY_013685 [Aphis glycines]|uniref:Uncharacterized protein n=1 Tax=Aphis glycines TaxID=307491 RepID=A0A6G0T768_APHGL|nr:hypothetical protein AGLY_013685 [Aphis glycines]